MDISDYDLHQIDRITVEKSYEKGDMIVEENTEAGKFLIIYSGKVEITKRFDDGEEFLLAVFSDGDFFGEMALLDEGPRSATAKAVEPTTIMEISHKEFATLMYKAPALAYKIMRELSLRLRETDALLISQMHRKHRQLAQAYLETLTAVARAVEARDPYAMGHTTRVRSIAKAIGKELGLSREELYTLEIGSLLHDIGKIGISEAILLKPGPLDDKEYEEIKQHPKKGREMIEGISYLKEVIPHVLYHHERLNGTGYPERLSGKNIPMVGRIIAVADVFDAMISDRPYRKKLSFENAVSEIKKEADNLFDPKVVDTLFTLYKSKRLSQLIKESKNE